MISEIPCVCLSFLQRVYWNFPFHTFDFYSYKENIELLFSVYLFIPRVAENRMFYAYLFSILVTEKISDVYIDLILLLLPYIKRILPLETNFIVNSMQIRLLLSNFSSTINAVCGYHFL